MDTRVAFAAVYFAAMRRGVAVVPLNVRETVAELESKVSRTEPDAIVCESATESLALEVADCSVVSVDESEREAVPSIRSALEAEGRGRRLESERSWRRESNAGSPRARPNPPDHVHFGDVRGAEGRVPDGR